MWNCTIYSTRWLVSYIQYFFCRVTKNNKLASSPGSYKGCKTKIFQIHGCYYLLSIKASRTNDRSESATHLIGVLALGWCTYCWLFSGYTVWYFSQVICWLHRVTAVDIYMFFIHLVDLLYLSTCCFVSHSGLHNFKCYTIINLSVFLYDI